MVVFTRDGEVFADSRDVAAISSGAVLRDIGALTSTTSSRALNLEETWPSVPQLDTTTAPVALPARYARQVVFSRHGEVFTKCRDVAEYFGKLMRTYSTTST
ncbi:hypothetical protein [Kaistia terrae]|uniref:Uncharacterized protein n=1 Tax=Kaistia terrae TaxID=537017 RepID=A0ABW0PZF5_9HYPH|nr:hypothetical protein [Kaistia terrae]MCX5580267.1 hypothetical protein [Kaistia terrae]